MHMVVPIKPVTMNMIMSTLHSLTQAHAYHAYDYAYSNVDYAYCEHYGLVFIMLSTMRTIMCMIVCFSK